MQMDALQPADWLDDHAQDADAVWRRYWRCWGSVVGIGTRTIIRLCQRFGDPRTAWQADLQALQEVPGVGSRLLRRIAAARDEPPEAKEQAWADRSLNVVTPFCTGYPQPLRELAAPPALLFIRGELELPAPAVAVVGSRRATAYGRDVAELLGRSLARAGVPVISGLALGIDAAAHHATVRAGGVTHAVLGHGLHTIAPARNRSLAERIQERGALVSELPPGVSPRPWYFPMRNRIIAGLAQATVVVQAAEQSGALLTANHAVEVNREVFAVPADIHRRRHRGANRLIARGAVPLLEPAELLHRLGVRTGSAGEDQAAELSPDERRLLACFGGDPVGRDRLVATLGWDPGRLATALAGLELSGRIQALPGGRYRRRMLRPDGPAGSAG